MNLQFIKEQSCPICGCSTVVKEEVEISTVFSKREVNKHTNGGAWEKRTFLCGQELKYIPNFSSVEISKYSSCTNNTEYRLKLEMRKKAKEKVLEFINELENVDEDYKKDLLNGRFYFGLQ